jgi:hypothetical protein
VARPKRPSLGALFILLAAAFAGVTYAAAHAARHRPGLWAVAIAAGVLTLWLATLGLRAMRG